MLRRRRPDREARRLRQDGKEVAPMEVREYAGVQPRDVLVLNLLTLGYSLDAVRVAAIREREARMEPFLALYAFEDGAVLGQVGAMRTTVETGAGPERFGALWAVATHPDHMRRGVASHLIGQVHGRFRAQGIRSPY